MDKIGEYTSTADGSDEFTEGNPSTGTPATEVDAGWLNGVQRELLEVMTQMGLTPSTGDDTLVWQAVKKVYGNKFAGDPNGNVAADILFERCWDTSTSVPTLYYATTADGTIGGTTWTRAQDLSVGIGQYVEVQDDLTGADTPSNDGDAKFIKLTAGEDGVGEFNEGLLINESVSGSAPLVEATAEIATGPMAGAVVHLLNTENRYVMPGESPGTVADDQMQGHWHKVTSASQGDIDERDVIATAGTDSQVPAYSGGVADDVNASDPISDGVNGTPRTGDHTNVKRIQATYYMRIA